MQKQTLALFSAFLNFTFVAKANYHNTIVPQLCFAFAPTQQKKFIQFIFSHFLFLLFYPFFCSHTFMPEIPESLQQQKITQFFLFLLI